MSLKKYLAEAEVKQNIPQAGDVFAIELEDGTLLETYIMSINSDTILLDATPKMISVLREWADLDGEAGDVLFEGQFKQSMHDAAERMELDDFVERFGHLFSPGEAREFWMLANDIEDDSKLDETDYQTEIDIVDRGEYDLEGDMAKDDLATIIRAARKLTGMLDDNENMPEWVQSKINKAADYVDTAADYIESNKERDQEQGVAEGSLEEVDRRGFLKGMGAAAVATMIPTGSKAEYSSYSLTDEDAQVILTACGIVYFGMYNKIRNKGVVAMTESVLADLKRIANPVFNKFIDDIWIMETFDKMRVNRPEQYEAIYRMATDSEAPTRLLNMLQRIKDRYINGMSPQDKAKFADEMGRTHRIMSLPRESVNQGMDEAKYQGREVPLGKPMRGDVKKFKVYVRDPSSGNIKKVNFGHGGTSARRAGQKTMKIKKSNPARRRSFRARHNCDNPGPRTKARYWSCRAW